MQSRLNEITQADPKNRAYSLLLTYVIQCITTQGTGRILDRFCKDINLPI